MRLVAKLLGLTLFGGIAVLGAPPAQAFLATQQALAPQLSKYGVTLCVDVRGSSTAPGTIVWAYPCNGTIAEQWNFVGPELQGLAPNLCLESKGGVAILTGCTGRSGQRWGYDNLQIYLLNASTLCLDAEAGAFQQLAIHKSSSTAATQRWNLH